MFNCGELAYFKQISPENKDFFNPNYFTLVEENCYPTNDIFAGIQHHPFLYQIMQEMCENYSQSNASLFNKGFSATDHTGFKRYNYDYTGSLFKEPPGQSTYMGRTIHLGPKIFYDFIEKHKIVEMEFFGRNTINLDYALPYPALSFYQSFSWGTKEITFPDDTTFEMLLKWIVTIILNDLSHEPRVLYLDVFSEVLNKNPHLIDGVIAILFTDFEKEVSKLEMVYMTNVWMTRSSLDFLIHIKKLETNYEVQFKYQFENKVTMNTYQEINKFMMLADKVPESFIRNIFDAFFTCYMPKYYPFVTETELANVAEFMNSHASLRASALAIYQSAYSECYKNVLSLSPEYASWLCKIIPSLTQKKINWMMPYLSIANQYRKPEATDTAINAIIKAKFEVSAYSHPTFQERLFFERTIKNLTAYLIDEIEKHPPNRTLDLLLIENICGDWFIDKLRPFNEKLLKILLSRARISDEVTLNPYGIFQRIINLRQLAVEHNVEPLIEYFEGEGSEYIANIGTVANF